MPSRTRRSRRSRLARALVVAGIVRFLAALLRLLPLRAAQGLGASIGGLGWYVAGRDRRRTLDHLGVAFPERSADERARLGRECFLHLGRTLGESLWFFTRGCEELARHVEVEGLEAAAAARADGRPAVFITGHCGNWELMAAVSNCNGLGITVVARGLDEAPLQRLLGGLRTRFGSRTIERGERGAARQLLRTLRSGGALGMLIDQDTKVDGVWVPFFGRPAYTPVGAARIALHQKTVVIPCFIERRADGSHLARFQPPLDLPDDEVAATALMTRAIEEQIRRVPEQWVWMHRRWRRQPPAAEPAGSAGSAESAE